MGDDGYKVVTAAIRKEAPKWHEFAEQTEPIHNTVNDAFLGEEAFFCGNPLMLMVPDLNAQLHQQAYESYRIYMADLLSGAIAEFPQLGEAMIKIAEEYEHQEEMGAVDLNKIFDALQWK